VDNSNRVKACWAFFP
jgi:hypothetical protein